MYIRIEDSDAPLNPYRAARGRSHHTHRHDRSLHPDANRRASCPARARRLCGHGGTPIVGRTAQRGTASNLVDRQDRARLRGRWSQHRRNDAGRTAHPAALELRLHRLRYGLATPACAKTEDDIAHVEAELAQARADQLATIAQAAE